MQSTSNRNPTSTEIESITAKFVSYLEEVFLNDKSLCTPIEGSQTVFEDILNCGWDVGIATGGWKKSALLKLKTAAIRHQDIPIAHSDDHIEREAIISIAINRAKEFYNKSHYEKVIYIGDRIWDQKAAEKINIDFIGIGHEMEHIKDKQFPHITNYSNLQLESCLETFYEQS